MSTLDLDFTPLRLALDRLEAQFQQRFKTAPEPQSNERNLSQGVAPLINLTKARVFKYRSIDDSGEVTIDPSVTALVGKNMSGKTVFLRALEKARPLGAARFDPVFDYPRKEYTHYSAAHNRKEFQNVVELTFTLDPMLIRRINDGVFAGQAVLPDGHSFTLTTDYGNVPTVVLAVDTAAALRALGESLKDVDSAPEVFAGADSLEQVLANIETRQVTPDSSLGKFLKAWRDRAKQPSKNWDPIEWHLWEKYIEPEVPRLLYFDDYKLLTGKYNLIHLAQKIANKKLEPSDETLLGLLELAGTTPESLSANEGYEVAKARLESIGASITEEVFKFWKENDSDLSVEFDANTDPNDVPPYNNGKNFYIRIKNRRHQATLPFDQSSKGFIWFFSFIAWFRAVENRVGTDKPVILLLDEPGLSLHALAQRYLLEYIDFLAKKYQIVYTTHSPFMVESIRLERVRVVEDRDEEGSIVTGELQGAGQDSLFPLQAALGYSVAQNLFIAERNVLVEGPADFIVLQHIGSILEARGRETLRDAVYVPVGGLDKVSTFIALLGANDLKLAVLHDRAAAPAQPLQNAIAQRLIAGNRVLDYSMFLDRAEADLEDMVPLTMYLDAFNAAYGKDLNGRRIAECGLPQHPRVVERIKRWLAERGIRLRADGDFNHYRVAQSLLPLLTPELNTGVLDRFERLFVRLNKALE